MVVASEPLNSHRSWLISSALRAFLGFPAFPLPKLPGFSAQHSWSPTHGLDLWCVQSFLGVVIFWGWLGGGDLWWDFLSSGTVLKSPQKVPVWPTATIQAFQSQVPSQGCRPQRWHKTWQERWLWAVRRSAVPARICSWEKPYVVENPRCLVVFNGV